MSIKDSLTNAKDSDFAEFSKNIRNVVQQKIADDSRIKSRKSDEEYYNNIIDKFADIENIKNDKDDDAKNHDNED
jgi:hypothetical protein